MAAPDPDILYVSGLVAAIFRSPTWVTPISTFVDQNCGIFEDQEENKLEYTMIHNAFKQLVDELLEAHLVELSVTTEQFTRFCQHGLTGDNEFHRELVEQLLSVDDFLIFKAMMIKRNAQLYRQALEMFGGFSMQAPSAPGGDGLLPPAPLPHPDMSAQALAAPEAAGMPPAPDYSEQLAAQEKLEAEHAELEAERVELHRKCVEAELQLAMALSMQLQKRLQLMEALSEILEAITEMRDGAEGALAAEAAASEAREGAPLQVEPMYAVSDGPDPAALQAEAEAAEAAAQRERAQRRGGGPAAGCSQGGGAGVAGGTPREGGALEEAARHARGEEEA